MKINGLGSPQPLDSNKKNNRNPDVSRAGSDSARQADYVELAKTVKPADYANYSNSTSKGSSEKATSPKRFQRIGLSIQTGYYDSEQVKERISDKIIISPEFENIVSAYKLSQSASNNVNDSFWVRQNKLAEVQKKINDGFYKTPDNFGKFADKIIDYFGI